MENNNLADFLMVKYVYFFINKISMLPNFVDEKEMKTLDCHEEYKGTQHVQVSLTFSLQLMQLNKL